MGDIDNITNCMKSLNINANDGNKNVTDDNSKATASNNVAAASNSDVTDGEFVANRENRDVPDESTKANVDYLDSNKGTAGTSDHLLTPNKKTADASPDGYIYCLSNTSYKANTFKVGYTDRNNPLTRVNELGSVTGVPTPFVLQFAKKFTQARQKESDIFVILDDCRLNPSREFFNCKLEKIRAIFKLIEGTWYEPNASTEKPKSPVKKSPVKKSPVKKSPVKKSPVKKWRQLKDNFIGGQNVRHSISIPTEKSKDIWVGQYSSQRNGIVLGEKVYPSLRAFMVEHYKVIKPDYKPTSNGAWAECECQIDRQWGRIPDEVIIN